MSALNINEDIVRDINWKLSTFTIGVMDYKTKHYKLMFFLDLYECMLYTAPIDNLSLF